MQAKTKNNPLRLGRLVDQLDRRTFTIYGGAINVNN